MLTLSRKQREIQQREARILALAGDMLHCSGYLGLSMDRIATEMEYSKGTIYQHYRNKEEIILALANEALQMRLDMFQKAATCAGRSRIRMAAIGAAAEVFVENHPQHFAVEQIVRSPSIWEKTSQERRHVMESCELRCMQVISGIVRDAIAAGDLELPSARSAEDLVFGLWSMNFGAYNILTSSETLEKYGISDPLAALRKNQNFMLDGYQWQPLSHQWDYDDTMDQLKREMFGDE